MVVDLLVSIQVGPNNYKYWTNLGYNIPKVGGRAGKNGSHTLEVKVCELPKKSNVYVNCRCNSCGKNYSQRYSRNKDICYDCRKSKQMLGNTFGTANKGRKLPMMMGENNPRHNPDLPEILRYGQRVRSYTRSHFSKELKELIGDKTIGRCGIPNAYQIDHKISIKDGFYNKIPVEVVGHINNLQILTWEENRAKWSKSSISIQDVLNNI